MATWRGWIPLHCRAARLSRITRQHGASRSEPAATGGATSSAWSWPCRRVDQHLRACGLRLIAIGCIVGLLYVAEKVAYLIVVLFGGSPSASVESSAARLLTVTGGLLVLAGSLVPAVYPRCRTAARWSKTYRAHRALYPLWSALQEITPEIALDPAASELPTGCVSGTLTSGCTGGSSRFETGAWHCDRSSTLTLPGEPVKTPSRVANATATWTRPSRRGCWRPESKTHDFAADRLRSCRRQSTAGTTSCRRWSGSCGLPV
jgi:hypothetical protein